MSNGKDYKHIPEDVSGIIDKLKTCVEEYKNKINELNSLISSIEGSSSWKDEQVKSEFISTCNSYIAIFRAMSLKMENFASYLNVKNNNGMSLDSAYMRG